MAISNAFKGAYVNQVSQQNQGINTISQGVKDLASTAMGIAGFTGALGGGALAQGAMHSFAGRVGGVGGNIMLSTLMEKENTVRGQKETENLFTGEEVAGTISSTLGDNPINRSAKKQLATVFETLQRAKSDKIINKKGTIDSELGEIDPNSELGKKVLAQLEGGGINDNCGKRT